MQMQSELVMRNQWMMVLEATAISSVTWIFCLGHAGVKRNEEPDKLVGQALIDGVLRIDKEY
jgi:ribonuclease HI